jgi:putative glutathione S-transferase
MTSTDTREPLPSEQGDDGSFRRKDSRFRDFVTADGSSGYKAEPGRYHLYVSSGCPWAHRTIIYRHLKGLEGAISMTIVDPERDERGWAITDTRGTTPDPVNGFRFLSEAYILSDSDFDGHVTVPVLWDRVRGRIVNNESSEIIRMLDSEFDAFAKHPELHFLPAELRAEIDELNAFVYENVNDGVYRTGFARSQGAYERAFGRLFDALDELDARLATRRYLMGSTITEADWRLFPTLLRFDPVYCGHFKCNLRRVIDYPQLLGYLRDLYQHPGIAQTVDMDHIKRHYYRTHPTLNPTRIVPVGPALDLAAPHGREHLS